MKKLAELLARYAVMRGDFVLASGKRSSYYINIKKAYTKPEVLREIIAEIVEKLRGMSYDYLAGVAVGAVPLVACTALAVNKPFLIVRKEEKGYGTGAKIEGEWEKGKRVVLLEDVTTTGGSVISAALALRGEGLICDNVIVVVDREEGAEEALKQAQLELLPLLKVSQLL
ncbi:orotate phosphoribosyltransferase [Candidatus Pyrohabitans sp.]